MAIVFLNDFEAYETESMMKPNTVHGKPLVTGMKFGIELEIEAGGLYETEEVFDTDIEEYRSEDPDIPIGWLKEPEDSIVGCELVTDGPYGYDEAIEQIEILFRDIRDRQGYNPIRTPRGSTHVHANVCDLTWEQMRSFVMACAWAEPALIELAGKGRKGNLFAQSYEICPIGWQPGIEACRREDTMMGHDTHYMATSFYPMMTLGSVEFRMGPSARTAQEAIDWLTNIKHVVQCGRETRVDNHQPYCLDYLFSKIPSVKHDLILRKARQQADDIWCALNRKYIKRRNKFQELAAQYGVDNVVSNPMAEPDITIQPLGTLSTQHMYFTNSGVPTPPSQLQQYVVNGWTLVNSVEEEPISVAEDVDVFNANFDALMDQIEHAQQQISNINPTEW